MQKTEIHEIGSKSVREYKNGLLLMFLVVIKQCKEQ
ncbi:MAG: hypothetical protein FD131_233 [Rhodocyclaceae bacterium]|nr:MAG: hypothetical protein FD131_233 [Rhodocyclaceae bacterium]